MLQYPSMSPLQSSMRSAVMTVARSNNRCYSIQLPLDFFTVGRTILTTDCRYVLYMDVEKKNFPAMFGKSGIGLAAVTLRNQLIPQAPEDPV